MPPLRKTPLLDDRALKRRCAPNFFIVGAPRCGTTSLYTWLAGHPQVYMSPVKEPRFFCTDLTDRSTFSIREYLALFDTARARNARIRGEASASYLMSNAAIPAIEQILPGSRYAVMLRNPFEMVRSWHVHLLSLSYQDTENISEAWRLIALRREGRFLPRLRRYPEYLDYERVCALGDQVERLLAVVPRPRVHFVLMDDMRRDPAETYRRVLGFLGLDDDGRTDFPQMNEGAWPRSKVVHAAVVQLSEIRRRFHLPSPPWLRAGLFTWAQVNKSVPAQDRYVPLRLPEEASRFLNAQIGKLECLLGRNLEHWREAAPNG
jgi:hypothetical protein